MQELFTMRLAAPIASLSGARIDTGGDTLPVPTRSMIAGIIGAALGIRYDQPQLLQQLQDTMRLGIVVHREGAVIRDYQTVRLGLPHMKGPMWWHDGRQLGVMEREGGDPERTITGERPLTCDYDATIIVELLSGAPFDADKILSGLRAPVYPLSVGQRGCIPTLPVAGKRLQAPTIVDAVSLVEAGIRYLPVELAQPGDFGDIYVTIPSGRNWLSRQHGGSDTYAVRT
jgi:CRISPR system Cascade subunit CasD